MYANTEENINTVGVDADERTCEHGPVRGVKWKRTCTQKDILCEDEHANVREDEHLEYEDEYEHDPISVRIPPSDDPENEYATVRVPVTAPEADADADADAADLRLQLELQNSQMFTNPTASTPIPMQTPFSKPVQTLIQIQPQYQAERANRHEPYGRNNTNTEEKGDHGVSGEKTLALAGNQLTPSSTSIGVTVTAAGEDRETGKSADPLEENSININININTSELIKKLGGVFIWTKQDDQRLLQILERHPPVNKQRSNWDMVAQELNQLCESESASASASVLASSSSTKTPKECFQRWTLYLSPPPRNLHKRRFTVEEDAIIVHSVQSAHPSKPCWTDICKLLSANHGKSTQTQTHEQPHPQHQPQPQHQPHAPHRIRERWHNLLNPKLQKMPFTNEEDVKLYEGLREHGQKWTVISKDFFLDTRSDIQLKNRFRTVTFQQFYAKVSARAMEFEKRDRERLRLGLGACIVGADVDSDIDMDVDADAVVPVEVDIAMDMNVSKGQGIMTSVLRNGDDDTGMEGHVPMDANRSLTDTNRKLVDDLNRGTSLLNGTDAEVEADTNVRIDADKNSIHVDDVNPGESGNGPVIANHIAKRLKRSLAAQIQGEDVPKPPPGKYFTPIGAAQILSRIGKSERRTVMRTWIDRNYVPVNLTSLYRTLGRYNSGKTLKPRWYCEGRMKSAG